MADKAQKQSGISRRDLLSGAAIGAGFLASISLLGKFRPGAKRADPHTMPLPGEGSIFQPRRDARLEEWEREHKA